MQSSRHTIILMQPSQNRATRTFMDYESISQAMDGMFSFIRSVFEKKNHNLQHDFHAPLFTLLNNIFSSV